MTNDTALRRRIPTPPRLGTIYNGPAHGADNVATWYADVVARYGGRPGADRLNGAPSQITRLFIQLRQRFGTDGLTPRGRAWIERLIHTPSQAERHEMAEALRTAFRDLSAS